MKRFLRGTAAGLVLILFLSLFAPAVAAPALSLEETLYQGMAEQKTWIDVSDYGMVPSAIADTMQKVLYTSPDLFYVGNQYAYELNKSRTALVALSPTYTIKGKSLTKARAVYNAAVEEIANRVNTKWSDVEKVLFVHDYLAVTYEYDLTAKVYDAYGLITGGTGVCQAYMLLFRAVMDKLGIESDYAYSDTMGHVWTVVNLDGQWYHLDVTWDDPTADRLGRVSHRSFLLSDAAIQSEDMGTVRHYGWSSTHTCTSTRFDTGMQWEGVNSPVVYCGGKWYYLRDYGLYTGSLPNGTEKKVLNLPDYWMNVTTPDYYWPGTFSGLSEYGGKLYFNKPHELCTFDPATGKVTSLMTTKSYIYGSRLKTDQTTGNVVMEYEVADDPNGTNAKIYTFLMHEHRWDEGTVTASPTCREDGVRTYTCLDCETTKTEVVESLGHRWGEWVPDDTGKRASRECSRCHEQEEHTHDFGDGEVLTPATCTKEGEARYICSVCEMEKTVPIPPADHVFSAWTVDTVEGVVRRTCQNCPEVEEHEFRWAGALSETELTGYSFTTAAVYRRAVNALTGALADGNTGYEDLLTLLDAVDEAEQGLVESGGELCGDGDGDGSVTTTDARLTLQFAAGKIGEDALDTAAVDVDATPGITTTDARLILQFAAGKIKDFPVTQPQ